MTAKECKDWLKGRVKTIAKPKIPFDYDIVKEILGGYAADAFIIHAEGDEHKSTSDAKTILLTMVDANETYSAKYGPTFHSMLDDLSNYGDTDKENQTDDRTLTIDLPEMTVKATIAASGYSTLVSIKALDFTNVEGLQGYVATSVNKEESKVTLTEVASVPVKTPVILKGTPGATYTIFTTTSPAELPEAGNLLRGSATESTALAAGEAYILYNGAFYSNEAGNLPAGKAYLPASTVNGAREMSIVFDSEPTAIAAPKASTRHTDIYNLQGQIVNTPSKGVYVVEGKKVVVK
jgi:hypothetical protein